jgi:16S rRNA (cytosine1402-N4)-methyltransferase
MHQPIMVAEVLRCLRPSPGDVALDCTLGSGAHARAVLERIAPAGRLIGIDADPLELPKTDARMRGEGFGPPGFIARLARFTDIRGVLDAEGVTGADVILADLGVSGRRCSTTIPRAASTTTGRARSTCAWIRARAKRRRI